MKLTEENADYQDCRPLIEDNELRENLLPEHLRARTLQRRAERAALAARVAARLAVNDNQAPNS